MSLIKGTNLPVPMTADGCPVCIGDIVYAIGLEIRKNKNGRFYRASTATVFPIKVLSIKFEDSEMEGGIVWTGFGYPELSPDLYGPSVQLGRYNAFSDEEKAKREVQQGDWKKGIADYSGVSPMPSSVYRKMQKELWKKRAAQGGDCFSDTRDILANEEDTADV